jgi:hypothetical protein
MAPQLGAFDSNHKKGTMPMALIVRRYFEEARHLGAQSSGDGNAADHFSVDRPEYGGRI